jgi:hypothetical protein
LTAWRRPGNLRAVRRPLILTLVLGGATLAGSACRRAAPDPVGRVTAEPAAVRLAYPQSLTVRLDWQPVKALEQRGRPVVFVHLLVPGEKKNVLLRTFDHALPGPWSAGQPQDDELELYQSALSEPLAPGRYVLALGLVDEATGERWPLQAAGPEVAGREYQVATVEVVGPDPSAPRFQFAGAWQPAETRPNRQVLDVRCFTGTASLAVEAAVPGAVRLLVTTPPKGPAQVRVTASGAPSWSAVVGPALRKWVGIDVAAGRSEIILEPAQRPSAAPGEDVPACLEVLAWRPASGPAKPLPGS